MRLSVGVSLALPLFFAGAAMAQAPSDVADLVGAKGAGGETQLQARGYRFVRVETGDDRKWSYWWHPQRRQCLSVATYDGRYQAITATPAPDCGERAHQADGRDDAGHDARGSGHHPDIGYARPQPTRETPSYAAPDGGAVMVDGQPVDLGLVCFGDGQRPGVANSYGWAWDHDRKRYVYGNRIDMTAQQFDASVMLQFWAGGGRIKLPRKLVPPIHSRGTDDGWWDVYNVSMQPDRISGEYRLNGLNKPRILVNRVSGQISIIGTADYAFRGTCDTVEAAAHRRF
ncbi:hypothetical protein [Sphingobium sp. YR768]|uniref:hypothetical protein n=1 Tax=Sphingobium sp. YR768 TaxID=1884365 RepID=UPI0008BAC02C|nr:hypothetical protein [Sphingobium sp. YR768]SER98242.1 hypothetical protein SAMN05518866_12856 [Sphingobium sp. YR768]